MNLPRYLQIEPVGQCNLRCEMCPIQFRKDGPPHGPPAFMPLENFVRILDQFPGLEELHLQGLGEPMMHPRFFDMVETAAARGVRVTTNTNMTLLNRRKAERLAACGLDTLHVSLDGAAAETFERIRARAKFATVVENLEMFLDARSRRPGGMPHLHLVAVVMRQNLDELPDLVRLAHGWGARQVFVQHLCHDFGESSLPPQYRPMRAYVQEQTLMEEDLARIERRFDEARQTAAVLGIDLRLPRPRPRLHAPGTPGPERCSWPWRGAYISYQGYAMPCCMVATPDRAQLGNVLESGVEAVWNGEAYGEFRRRLASDEPPDICRSCSVYHGTF